MVKLVYTRALGARTFGCGSSSLPVGTLNSNFEKGCFAFVRKGSMMKVYINPIFMNMKRTALFVAVLVSVSFLSGCALWPKQNVTVPIQDPKTPIVVSTTTSTLGGEDPVLGSPSSASYSFEFPLNFSLVTSTYYGDKFTSEHTAAQFPSSSVLGISSATIDVGIGEQWCRPDLFSNGSVITTSTRMISGLLFQKVSLVDPAAGNQYRSTVYFAKRENSCYAIVMFLHTTSPENYANSVEESVKLRQKFDTELEKINTIFDRVAGTFHFRAVK